MCGISFYCTNDNSKSSELTLSLLKTVHRGPDASGTFTEKIKNYHVGLGHNRLSIIDLSDAGVQPMYLDDNLVIVYNGEIYNYQTLRKELLDKNYEFKSTTDTEVLLNLYKEYGVSAFSRIKGMYAFTLLDKKKEKIYVVRDCIGIKPVYIHVNDNGIYGCSEIKGLKKYKAVDRSLSDEQIFEFFNTGFLYEPYTGYQHIKKLMPGHYLEFDLNTGKIGQLEFQSISDWNNQKTLDEKIDQAIQHQLIADVPLGTFFSGGTDSSILASYIKKNDLFFAEYGADQNADVDKLFANNIANFLQKKLVVAKLTSDSSSIAEIFESIDFVAKNTEELLSDYTFWATYKLSQAAREKGYVVMLSGMGGDEAFAGYPRYQVLKKHKLVKLFSPLLKLFLYLNFIPKKFDKKFERLVSYSSEKFWPLAYSRLLGYFSDKDLDSLLKNAKKNKLQYLYRLKDISKNFKGNRRDKVKFAQYLDLKGFLAHNLTVSDKASMLASIELRVPLLDESIVAHGHKMLSKDLLEGNVPKKPLLKILSEKLPINLIDRPKTGFNPPLDGLIEKIGERRLKEELGVAADIINVTFAEKIIEAHFSGQANNTYKLWQLLYFCRWLKFNNVDGVK